MKNSLIKPPLFEKIKNYLRSADNSKQIFLYVPYIKTDSLEKLIDGLENKITIVTDWSKRNLSVGSSELKLYSFCKTHGISLYHNENLHLKVYSINLESIILATGNISQRGLMPKGNIELATLIDEITPEERLFFEKIKNDSILITDEIYAELEKWVEENPPNPPKNESFPQLAKQENKEFLISALPMTREVKILQRAYDRINQGLEPSDDEEITNCVYHDLANYEIESSLSREEFLEKLKEKFFAHPFIRRIDQFLTPCGQFGQIKQWVQENCTTVPIPSRRELTGNVQVLFEWFEILGDGKYKRDVPGAHSERLCKENVSKIVGNPILQFKVGQLYHHDEIWKPLGLGWAGGIRASTKNKIVVLFWNAPSPDPQKERDDEYARVNIYEDHFDEKTGLYHYIGEGQVGDQTLESGSGGNKKIVKAKEMGRTMHLFHQHENDGKHEYLGEVELVDTTTTRQSDINEKDRQVLVFLLKHVEKISIQNINETSDQEYGPKILEILSQPGYTIPQIQEKYNQLPKPRQIHQPNDPVQEKYRHEPIWHYKNEIDEKLKKILPSDVVKKILDSGRQKLEIDSARVITKLNENGIIIVWYNTGSDGKGGTGDGIWRYDDTTLSQLRNELGVKNERQKSDLDTKVVLFSVSSEAALEHYENSILNDVKTSNFPPSEIKQLSNVRMWGAIDRSGNNNSSKWSKLKKGDILLFFRKKKYVAKMILDGTEDSYEIAKMVWGEKTDHEEMNVDPISGETWQLIMYASSENVKQIDVADSDLNKLLGYQANFPGPLRAFDFMVVSDARLKKLQNQYGSVQKALESIGI